MGSDNCGGGDARLGGVEGGGCAGRMLTRLQPRTAGVSHDLLAGCLDSWGGGVRGLRNALTRPGQGSVFWARPRSEASGETLSVRGEGRVSPPPRIERRRSILGVRMVDYLRILRSILGLVLSQKHRDALLR